MQKAVPRRRLYDRSSKILMVGILGWGIEKPLSPLE
jgi:hypothetical protein